MSGVGFFELEWVDTLQHPRLECADVYDQRACVSRQMTFRVAVLVQIPTANSWLYEAWAIRVGCR